MSNITSVKTIQIDYNATYYFGANKEYPTSGADLRQMGKYIYNVEGADAGKPFEFRTWALPKDKNDFFRPEDVYIKNNNVYEPAPLVNRKAWFNFRFYHQSFTVGVNEEGKLSHPLYTCYGGVMREHRDINMNLLFDRLFEWKEMSQHFAIESTDFCISEAMVHFWKRAAGLQEGGAIGELLKPSDEQIAEVDRLVKELNEYLKANDLRLVYDYDGDEFFMGHTNDVLPKGWELYTEDEDRGLESHAYAVPLHSCYHKLDIDVQYNSSEWCDRVAFKPVKEEAGKEESENA